MAIQWYPRYPGDYSRDTRSLSLSEHGAYTLLLDELYVTRKPLPKDIMQLHRICNAHGPAEQAAVASVIQRFFTESQGGWVQMRAIAEIQKQANISRKRRIAALKSHGMELALEPSGADANDVQLQTHPHSTSTSTSSQPQPQGDKIAPDGAKGAFGEKNGRPRDVIWDAMLQVCGIPLTADIPPSARGAYNKACAGLKRVNATPESIKAHAEAYLKKWPKVSLTPTALERRWNECMVQERRP